MTILTHNTGYILDDICYFGPEEDAKSGLLCLATKKGGVMQYGESTVLPISFPGEYDRAGVLIKCYGTGDDLHYVLDLLSGSRVALIQSPAVLEQENIEGVETRYVMDDSIKTEIEQLELDGDVVILGSDD